MGLIIKHLSESDNFHAIIGDQSTSVVVDFYADWCGPCKLLTPILESKLANLNVTLLKIDVDEFADIAEEFKVSSIPHVILFKNGKQALEFIGNNTEKINQMLGLI
jgi:hypothetical protein